MLLSFGITQSGSFFLFFFLNIRQLANTYLKTGLQSHCFRSLKKFLAKEQWTINRTQNLKYQLTFPRDRRKGKGLFGLKQNKNKKAHCASLTEGRCINLQQNNLSLKLQKCVKFLAN